MRVTTSDSSTSPSLEKWLVSENPDEQALADETLAEMGPEASVSFLLAVIARESPATYQPHQFWYAHALSLPFSRTPNLVIVSDWFNASLYVTGPLGDWLTRACFRKMTLRRAVLERLSRCGDVRAVPALLEGFLNGDDPQTRNVCRAGLTRLLPRLTAEHRDLLNEHQWSLLIVLMRYGARPEFDAMIGPELARAILHGLGNVGYQAARREVEKLAETPAVESEEARRLQQAARNYLPLLIDEDEARKQQQTLNRHMG